MKPFRSLYVTWGGRRRLLLELQRGCWGFDFRVGYRAHHWTLSYRLEAKEDT